MDLKEQVNKAKKAITDAVADLSLSLDSVQQGALEAVQAQSVAEAKLESLKLELSQYTATVDSLRLEKDALESAVADLKAFLDKHLK